MSPGRRACGSESARRGTCTFHLRSARAAPAHAGGPTALGVIYLAVAEELGLHAEPISLPSHFLVRLRVDGQGAPSLTASSPYPSTHQTTLVSQPSSATPTAQRSARPSLAWWPPCLREWVVRPQRCTWTPTRARWLASRRWRSCWPTTSTCPCPRRQSRPARTAASQAPSPSPTTSRRRPPRPAPQPSPLTSRAGRGATAGRRGGRRWRRRRSRGAVARGSARRPGCGSRATCGRRPPARWPCACCATCGRPTGCPCCGGRCAGYAAAARAERAGPFQQRITAPRWCFSARARSQITTATHSRLQWHYQQALSVLRYMLLLQPQEEGHVVDLAMCLVGLNRREEAIDAMRAFQRLHPQSANVLRVREGRGCAMSVGAISPASCLVPGGGARRIVVVVTKQQSGGGC